MLPLIVRVFAMMLSLNPDADTTRLGEAITAEIETLGPLLADDVDGGRSAAIAVETAWSESRFDMAAKGDGGASWCAFQIHIGNRKTREGWTGKELAADPTKCARVGYRMLKHSFTACPKHPLAVYVSGNCDSKAGRAISARRMKASDVLYREFGAVKQEVADTFWPLRPYLEAA